MKETQPPDNLDRFGTDIAEKLRMLARIRGLWIRSREEREFTKLGLVKHLDRIVNSELDDVLADRVSAAERSIKELSELTDIAWLAGRQRSAEALWFSSTVVGHALDVLRYEIPPTCAGPRPGTHPASGRD